MLIFTPLLTGNLCLHALLPEKVPGQTLALSVPYVLGADTSLHQFIAITHI